MRDGSWKGAGVLGKVDMDLGRSVRGGWRSLGGGVGSEEW